MPASHIHGHPNCYPVSSPPSSRTHAHPALTHTLAAEVLEGAVDPHVGGDDGVLGLGDFEVRGAGLLVQQDAGGGGGHGGGCEVDRNSEREKSGKEKLSGRGTENLDLLSEAS